MGWSNDQIELLIIVAGSAFSGVFVYSPSPGAGHLITSISAQSGATDPYGNLILQGITAYTGNPTPIAIQTSPFDALIEFLTATTEAGPYTRQGYVGLLAPNDIQLFSNHNVQLFAGIANFIIANSQLNMGAGGGAGTGKVINILDQAQPSTPGFGVKLWSGTLGNLETVAGDGNVYGTQRLLLEATGQTVNSTGFVAVTGWGSITLQIATYHIRGRLFIAPQVQGGAIELKFTAGGGLTAPAFDMPVNERTWAVAGGLITWGNGIDLPLGATFTSTTVGAGLGLRIIEFDGKITVTAGGTLTPQVATTVAADTYNIAVGSSYIEVLPIGA